MNNMPELKIGVVAVSRDCFPESLSVSRREALMKAYTEKYGDAEIYECPICIVESEIHMVQALEDIKKAEYMSNFIGCVYEGVISGILDFGVFVKLDNTCEGFVSVSTMKDDFYDFDERTLALKSKYIYNFSSN